MAPQQHIMQHPAPLPSAPEQISHPDWKPMPPKVIVRVNNLAGGIEVAWATEEKLDMSLFASITHYEIYGYQVPPDTEPSTEIWKYVDQAEALILPMAATLIGFQENVRYYFAVRGVDEHKRVGPFSSPETWLNL